MKALLAIAAVAVIGATGLYAYETNRTWKREADAEAKVEAAAARAIDIANCRELEIQYGKAVRAYRSTETLWPAITKCRADYGL